MIGLITRSFVLILLFIFFSLSQDNCSCKNIEVEIVYVYLTNSNKKIYLQSKLKSLTNNQRVKLSFARFYKYKSSKKYICLKVCVFYR